jgi:hypothetical protein
MTDWRQARYLVLDTETTGLDPAVDRIVELAASLVDVAAGTVTPVFDERVNPGRPIPPEASAIHHLRDRDVAHAAPWEEVWARFQATVPAHDALLAHNAPFDHAFCAPDTPAWLDSLRAARHLWPEAPRHTNQVLRYWLDLEVDAARRPRPHRRGAGRVDCGAVGPDHGALRQVQGPAIHRPAARLHPLGAREHRGPRCRESNAEGAGEPSPVGRPSPALIRWDMPGGAIRVPRAPARRVVRV